MKYENKKNIYTAIISQFSCALMSGFVILLAPKLFTNERYNAIQLMMLYLSYVGLFHLGNNDGMLLRIAGIARQDLLRENILQRFYLLIGFNSLMAALIIFAVIFSGIDNNKRTILIIAAICIPLMNGAGFLGFIYQALGESYVHMRSIVIEKAFGLLLLMALVLTQPESLFYYIIWIPVASGLSLFYIYIRIKEMPMCNKTNVRQSIKMICVDARQGVQVMVSTVAGSWIIGGNLLIIERYYGLAEFGKIALANTMATFILAFFVQASMVFLPILRKMNMEEQLWLLRTSEKALTPILFAVLILYYPISIFINHWMPLYGESTGHLAILMPLLVFEGKMILVYGVYLKSVKFQKYIMLINIAAALLVCLTGVVCAEIFKNKNLAAYVILLGIILRSVFAKIVLTRVMSIELNGNFLYDVFGIIVFMGFATNFSESSSFFSLIAIISLYIFKFNKNIKELYNILRIQ
jgi:hypothetical protein